jgi:hypothetical protein
MVSIDQTTHQYASEYGGQIDCYGNVLPAFEIRVLKVLSPRGKSCDVDRKRSVGPEDQWPWSSFPILQPEANPYVRDPAALNKEQT